MLEQAPTTRQCPFCKEEINVDAMRCKHCQAAVSPQEKPNHQGICPFCKETIHPEAIRCKHCKSDLLPGQESFFRGPPTLPPFQQTAKGRRLVVHNAKKSRGAGNEPTVDPSGCYDYYESGGHVYCLDYVYIELDTNETYCYYVECAVA
jgi:hypothetical protein